jgi:hypothetical protein
MTHDTVLERLDDWAGGELSPPDRAEVELHLAGCAECRIEAEALRSLLEEVAALPAEVLPQRDLWAGIAPRLQQGIATLQEDRTPSRRYSRWGLQAAAAVVLMVGTSLVTRSIIDQKPGVEVSDNTTKPGGTDARPAESALVTFQRTEPAYQSAVGELQGVLNAKRNRLAPETVRTLEANLRIIDQAIQQSREALMRDPNSAEVAEMLSQAYDQKLNVLQQAVTL